MLEQAWDIMTKAYQCSNLELLKKANRMLDRWDMVDGYPSYEKHNLSNVVRNRRTKRILKPNHNNQVRMYHAGKMKWIKQGDIDYHQP
ncbi:hypothetical protein [Vibrio sp. 1CM23M]|uniref:hypothetical protein n=1 Tax=Vibrio sp. 1CM23M TaxID=2929164 RepID=UPI0020C13042|nr:hypothetical protein [Vibrio sp. 1CM23M]MCK8071586.1 hypothetical protein [Vibrio sp. 1CM23M]